MDKIKTILAGIDGLEERTKNSDCIAGFRNGQIGAYALVKELIYQQFPELQESEDERIRKWIVSLLHELRYDPTAQPMALKAIEYLEKQKDNKSAPRVLPCPADWFEQKPLSTEETELNSIAFLEQLGYTCVPPGAEQKPAERSDSVAKEMFIKALERAVEQTKKGYELTDCDKHSWWEDFKAYSEIKPAEWSEEDEELVEELIKLAEYYTDTEDKTEFKPHISWLKDLPNRFALRPKQEWNEEDEEHLDSIIESYKELLKDYSANHGVDYIPYNTPVVARTVLNDIKFLKSLPERFNLPPKQKLNDEDEHRFELLIAMCEDEQDKSSPISTNYREMQETKDWLKNRFKSLRPQPHWKPSEEHRWRH